MKATQALQKASRRIPLNTKQASTQYYKGNRSGSMGWHTKHGAYVIDLRKVRTFVAPEWLNENLMPFVAKHIKPVDASDPNLIGQIDGKTYLEKWKRRQKGKKKRKEESMLLAEDDPTLELMSKSGEKSAT